MSMFGEFSPKYPGVNNQNAINNYNGILNYAHGGTGLNSLTANGILYASSTTAFSLITSANNGVLITSAGGVPSISSTLPNAVQLNITSVGTIGAGTWNGGVIGIVYGGTNLNSYTQGDLIYASATNTLTQLAKNTSATRYLANTGTSNNPNWDQINLTNGVTGALPAANGGIGSNNSSAANGAIPIGNGSGFTVSTITAGSNVTVTNGAGTITIASTGGGTSIIDSGIYTYAGGF